MFFPEVENFLKDFSHSETVNIIALPQSGSARQNFIGTVQNEKYIITRNSNILENESFFYFSELFNGLNLNTPKIHQISEDRTAYIQSYLGNQTLSDCIQKEGLSERVKILVRRSLQKLFELQTKTQNNVDYTKTFEYEAYDEIPIIHDLFYFKFMFADVLEAHYHKTKLIKEFKKLANLIEKLEPKGLMIRDFQSRNIMVNDNDDVYFIDYQSAMKGPLMYDVTSFLFQAKANFPNGFREEMLNYYYSLWNDTEIETQLKNSLKPLQLIRFIQVLGVYGFRGLVQKKTHFINSIEQGLRNLSDCANNWENMNEFPELRSIIEQLCSNEIRSKIQEIAKI